MLVNLREAYWSRSIDGRMSETSLHHFELEAQEGNVERALGVLERVRGRTAAALLENKVTFSKNESADARALETLFSSARASADSFLLNVTLFSRRAAAVRPLTRSRTPSARSTFPSCASSSKWWRDVSLILPSMDLLQYASRRLTSIPSITSSAFA